jgi:hypothetical protein
VIGLDEINVAINAINPHVGATNAMRDAFGDDAALEQRKHLCREIGVDYEALMAFGHTSPLKSRPRRVASSDRPTTRTVWCRASCMACWPREPSIADV